MRLVGEMAVAVADALRTRPLSSFVAAARARDSRDRQSGSILRRTAGTRDRRDCAFRFADHHPFVAADLEFGDALPVLMTEKDAIKCVTFASPDVWCMPVSADLPSTFIDALVARLRSR